MFLWCLVACKDPQLGNEFPLVLGLALLLVLLCVCVRVCVSEHIYTIDSFYVWTKKMSSPTSISIHKHTHTHTHTHLQRLVVGEVELLYKGLPLLTLVQFAVCVRVCVCMLY
jgi:hypothetical protein